MSFFEVTNNNGRARTGIIRTAHGDIETPAFMVVGTQGTVKALDVRDLHEAGAQILLGNTYHLHLRPGEDAIADFGGLHKFMGWDGPILTDSGGFQVFSLAKSHPELTREECHPEGVKRPKDLRRMSGALEFSTSCVERDPSSDPAGLRMTNNRLVAIDDDGVTFRSHIDGSEHPFTPESAIGIQHKIGADIIMAFDQCTKDDVSENEARIAMERTHAWAKRCVEYHKASPSVSPPLQGGELGVVLPRLFGIIQGSRFKNLRRESAEYITSLPFDGIAIGGESIGYKRETTKEILGWISDLLPEDKPRYTMGVGFEPDDIFNVVEQGIDMFDCVAPTRMARHGSLYISPLGKGGTQGGIRLDITNAQYKTDKNPIDAWCQCKVCKIKVSRGYLHHLFKTQELLGYRLASIHNVHFVLQLMREIRASIKSGEFQKLKESWVTV